jgi:histidinol-phosphate/aromatic aminotransferase/cobyric acid decarboxylase-like protein
MVKYLVGFLVVCVVGHARESAWGDPGGRVRVESMVGKYDGVIQVVKLGAAKHPYQTEIVTVNSVNNTVSLSSYCPDCENKELKRTNCQITEAGVKIRFICKGPTSDEVYTFIGRSLQATGFGNRYPYSINVTKVDE